MKKLFSGVYNINGFIATLNAVRGKRVYNEKLMKEDGLEYRGWDPFRSKLCAAIKKGLKNFPIDSKSKIMYLGASTGTTISHLSDILLQGEIFAVEIASQCMKNLLELSELRPNIIPILADARRPQDYVEAGKVDLIYQDVASPEQAQILIKNAQVFLDTGGLAMVAIKSQSIDVTKEPREVFEAFLNEVSVYFEVLEQFELEPFDKDHLFVVLKKK
ncbi:MAG: fibrillarin-like rRNA/tRNA 2'-O-methyltransferase [Candidatus Micrarchaeota archaeon]